MYSLITGIQKIRLSGSENRAFAKWSQAYAQSAALTFNPPAIIVLSGVITTAITLIGTAVMYFIAVKSKVSVADYYAFNTAYAYISSAFASLTAVALSAASIKPVINLIKPLLAFNDSAHRRQKKSGFLCRLDAAIGFYEKREADLIFKRLHYLCKVRLRVPEGLTCFGKAAFVYGFKQDFDFLRVQLALLRSV